MCIITWRWGVGGTVLSMQHLFKVIHIMMDFIVLDLIFLLFLLPIAALDLDELTITVQKHTPPSSYRASLCLTLCLRLPFPIPTLKVGIAVELVTQPPRVHHLVIRGLQAKRLIQPRRQALHALARAQDDLGFRGRGFGHPPYRQGGFGLAVLGEEGRVDDEAVKGRFEGCCEDTLGSRAVVVQT